MQIIRKRNNEELESVAESFLEQHRAGSRDGRALRIEFVIEAYGYTIWPIHGMAEIAEAYIPMKSGYIFVDEDQYLTGTSFRWRFTLAEELAHLLIHRPLFEGKSIGEIERMQKALSDDEYRLIEQQAKYLAGAILMPRSDFKARFEHFFEIQQQRTVNWLQVLRYTVRELSRDFHVSCYSVALRALHLGCNAAQCFVARERGR